MKVVDIKAEEDKAKIMKDNRFQSELKKRVQENEEYNKNIFEHKSTFDRLEILDGNIVVRNLKFTGERDNDGLFIERKYTAFETEGGNPSSKLEYWQYATGKAVVIKMPTKEYIESLDSKDLRAKYERLKEGDVVWLYTNMLRSENYIFMHERDTPVAPAQGYLYIPIAGIQMIERS